MRKIFIYSWPLFLAVLVFLSVRVSVKNPVLIEHYYSNGIYPFIEKGVKNYNQVVSLVICWYYNSALKPEKN